MAELDLAGIITRVCEDLKIKFSKVSFTSTRNTPNTVAFITVDGVTHGICAPAASTDTPLMDGTASYGTSNNYYARADHVHPTDTSRQAALVSGTNIKTINNQSLLGSGNISISSGGGSSWTDISSLAWECSTEDVATIHAKTSGPLVCLSVDVANVDISEYPFHIYMPTGYEPAHISVTQFTSDSDPEAPAIGIVTASPYASAVIMTVTEPDFFSVDNIYSFTLIYPIA